MITSAERGSGTLLVLGFGAIVIAAGMLALALATTQVAQHRADIAAELAALSAVPLAYDASTPVSPCQLAAEIVAAHHARLTSCRVTGAEVEVVTEISHRAFGWPFVLHSRARAGPGQLTSILKTSP